MKKILAFILLVFSTYAIADERPLSGYVDLHALGGYPLVGIGVRSQTGMHRFDFSANMLPYVPNQLRNAIFHLKGMYLLYPNQQGLYLGGGLGLANLPDNYDNFIATFENSLGYQWKTSEKTILFLEANASTFLHKNERLFTCPGITFGFGF